MLPDNVCVVHLVRRCNGLEIFERFISAYRNNEPGIDHRLLILFKGFDSPEDLSRYRIMLSGLDYLELLVPDTGYDIGSYMMAFQAYHQKYQYFCFLNSYSEPLYRGWLALLYRHASRPEVGLVGVTGSYQSLYSDAEFENYIYTRTLVYARTLRPFKRVLIRAALTYIRFTRFPFFASFPNPHVRTNGFMLPTSVLLRVRAGKMRCKMDAYRFESGRQGLTPQVLRMGRKPVVVGADGAGYDIEDWYKSNTFRRANQENLLIADNQTRAYADGDLKLKVSCSHHAWGDKAWPDVTTMQRQIT